MEKIDKGTKSLCTGTWSWSPAAARKQDNPLEPWFFKQCQFALAYSCDDTAISSRGFKTVLQCCF